MIRASCVHYGFIAAIRINGQISLLRDVNEITLIMKWKIGIIDQIVCDTYLLNFRRFREIHQSRFFVIH